jgi:hypothetical protein
VELKERCWCCDVRRKEPGTDAVDVGMRAKLVRPTSFLHASSTSHAPACLGQVGNNCSSPRSLYIVADSTIVACTDDVILPEQNEIAHWFPQSTEHLHKCRAAVKQCSTERLLPACHAFAAGDFRRFAQNWVAKCST